MDTPYTIAMLEAATGIPRRTIISHIASGDLRAVKLGPNTGAWIIPAGDAAAYIAAHPNRSDAA